MSMSSHYGAADDVGAIATVRRAVDLGVTFFDTSDAYGLDGRSEDLVGRALAGCRGEVVLASKFSMKNFNRLTLEGKVDGRPEPVSRYFDASLARLRTDHLDLYYLHRADPEVPIEDTIGAMGELVEAGKVQHLGLCEVSARRLERAVAVHPIAALQSEWSLWSRDIEAEVLLVARRVGIGIVPYAPPRARSPHWHGEEHSGLRPERHSDRDAALPGRKLGQEFGARAADRSGGVTARMHARPARTRLADGARQRRRAHSRSRSGSTWKRTRSPWRWSCPTTKSTSSRGSLPPGSLPVNAWRPNDIRRHARAEAETEVNICGRLVTASFTRRPSDRRLLRVGDDVSSTRGGSERRGANSASAELGARSRPPRLLLRDDVRPGRVEISDRNKLFRQRKRSESPESLDPVTLIHPEVRPTEDEVVISKHRVNPMFGTALNLILRANNVETLIVLVRDQRCRVVDRPRQHRIWTTASSSSKIAAAISIPRSTIS